MKEFFGIIIYLFYEVVEAIARFVMSPVFPYFFWLLVAVVACTPMIEGIILSYFPTQQITAMAFGGSSMMIVVGGAIETIRELEAQLSLRNYKGFLD